MVGDSRNGKRYTVSKPINDNSEYKISDIIEDENYTQLFGETRVEIYVCIDGEKYLWKRSTGQPMDFTYELPIKK